MNYGDCFIVKWHGLTGDEHTGILDSGTAASYKSYLRKELQVQLEDIDFWVISHIHDDHIGGVLKYIDDIDAGLKLPQCKNWIINIPLEPSMVSDKSSDGSIAESVRQGNKLIRFLNNKKASVCQPSLKNKISLDFDGLVMHFVSVSPSNLDLNIDEDYSLPMASLGNDYKTLAANFRLDNFEEDKNSLNAASLSLIIEYNGKRLLWLSDSHPSNVIKGLKSLCDTTEYPLYFDFATVAHHGSKGNTNLELLKLLNCNNYIITSNGENKHQLPNKETLVRILKNPRRDLKKKISFIFPTDTHSLRSLFDVDGKEIHDTLNFDCKFGVTSLNL